MNTPLLIISFALCGAVIGEEVKYEKDDEIVKRQIQYDPRQYSQSGQGAQQLPAEYLQLLQQLEGQQLAQPGADPQSLNSGAPQTFRGQPPRRPAPRITPEQEQQRRLQQNVVQKTIREQEVRDQQNRDRVQVEQYYASQGIDIRAIQRQQLQMQREAAAQQYQAELQARLQQQQQQPQYALQPQAQPQYVQPQYAQPQEQPQYVQPQQQPQYVQSNPQRISYSQVRFGSTKLQPQNIPTLQASYKEPEPAYYTQRQPQAYRQQQQVVYEEVDEKTLPQQYLIETTKPQEQVVSIPKPREQLYYKPQPQPQPYQQQYEGTTPSSKSSIYVTTSSTPVLKPTYARQTLQEVRLPRVENKRPLSQGELNALIDAGFQVSPTPDPVQDYEVQQQNKPNYYRGLGKRQNKLIPSPVRLTEAERESLAKEGIRNVYRVVPAESQDAPPTYVLAVDPSTKRKF